MYKNKLKIGLVINSCRPSGNEKNKIKTIPKLNLLVEK